MSRYMAMCHGEEFTMKQFVKFTTDKRIISVHETLTEMELQEQLKNCGFKKEAIETLFEGVENREKVFPYLEGGCEDGGSRFLAAVYPALELWGWWQGREKVPEGAPYINVLEESVPVGIGYMNCYYALLEEGGK